MHLASADRSPSSGVLSATTTEIARDLVLDADIQVGTLPVASDSWREVLLTGSTGFLGAYLLRDLLRESRANITCLVRGESNAEARSRVETNLSRYGLELTASDWRRVNVVAGDLSRPAFALGRVVYERLATSVDAVFHGAATINFYQTYGELRETNVGGTREMLRFVTTARLKAFHYISSTGVFDSDAARGVIVREEDAAAHCEGSVMGYTQTKWVAEQLVLTARSRGIPASVYRTPFIMGDSETGVTNHDNLVVKMFLGCIPGGYWPDERTKVEMVPVNSLSRAVVYLAQRAHPARTFHIASPEPMSWSELGLAARAYGYSVALPSYADWKRHLADFGRHKNNAMRPLLRFYTKTPRGLAVPAPEVFCRPPRPIFDSTTTQAMLAPVGLVPPRMTQALIGRYFDYFIESGWLPSPKQLANAVRAEKSPGGSRPPQMACGSPA